MLLLVLIAAAGSPTGASAAAPELSLAGDDELTVEASDGKDSATGELVVVNPGPSVPFTVTFNAFEKGTVELVGFEPKELAAEGATPVKVTFSGLAKLDKATSGALVVKGGAVPAVRVTKIAPGIQPSTDWPQAIMIGALVAMAALGLGIAVAALLKRRMGDLAKKAPGPKWSFESWATTLTAAGAVFGTVVAAATFPEAPEQISKDSLVAISLLFGTLVVIAPFVFQTLRNPQARASDQEGGLWGYNWALLISCAITCGAVLGELACLGLLSWELIGGGGWAWTSLVAVAILGILALYYFAVTTWDMVTTDWQAETEKGKVKKVTKRRTSRSLGTAGPELEETDVEATEVEEVMVSPLSTWSLP